MFDKEVAANKGANKGLIWDTIKMKICGLTISHSRYKAKQTRTLKNELPNIPKVLEGAIALTPNDNNRQVFVTLTK